MKRIVGLVAVAVVLGMPSLAGAAVIGYSATMSGPNENPANASPGTGNATLIIDTTAHTMCVSVAFSGLTAGNTAAHIHCCVASPGTAGVATPLPGFPPGVTSGSYLNTLDLTSASSYNPAFFTAHGNTPAAAEAFLLTGLAAGQAYFNIHSSTFPGGEIRGFFAAAATPTISVSPSSISAPSGGMSGTFNVITSSGCPWSATSNAAWLTTSSAGTGNGSVSYTVAANTSTSGRSGTITVTGQGFTVTQSGVQPSNLVATATSTPSVSLTWNSSAVDHFEVWRNSGAGLVLRASPTTAGYTDSSVVANSAYLYRVRAVDSTATASAYSNPDLATTILFTDDPLVPSSTIIKAVHLTQLRQAVTAVSVLAGTGTPTFTDSSPAGVFIRLVHVTELRNALDPARGALGLPPLTYTSIMIGSPVGATDFTELRNGVK